MIPNLEARYSIIITKLGGILTNKINWMIKALILDTTFTDAHVQVVATKVLKSIFAVPGCRFLSIS